MGIRQRIGEAGPAVSHPGAQAPSAASLARLDHLLTLEAAAREASSPVDLAYIIANDWLRVVEAGQIFVARRVGRRWRIVAATGLSSVDGASPLIVELERVLAAQSVRERAPILLSLDPGEGPAAVLPHRSGLITFLRLRDGTVFAAAMLMRPDAWKVREAQLVDRLGGAFGHAWAALEGNGRLRQRPLRRALPWAAAVLLAGASAWPVPLTALAPAEVVPRDSDIVAAPLDGVIRSVEVDPNAPVRAGDVLVRFVDTTLRSRYEVAEQNVAVAQARERRLAQAAFDDRAARRELAVAGSELRLAEVEREAARGVLERAEVRAERDGVAVFQNRKDLEGRPVATGERLMSIARPDQVEVRVDLPVKDSLLAREDAPVRIYLDADPLQPLDGRIVQAAFQAAPVPGGGLAYQLRVRLDGAGSLPRIGFRGTAQVHGDTVPLGYLLLRRPITALFQHVVF